jgi:hypothetical protein
MEATMTEVHIEVVAGVVVGAYSTDPDTFVKVLDYDLRNAGEKDAPTTEGNLYPAMELNTFQIKENQETLYDYQLR